MNQISRKLCIALISALVVFAGCTKKPKPAPTDTNPMGTSSQVAPTNMGNLTDASATGLQQRDGVIEDDMTIRGLPELQSVFFDFDRSAVKQSERAKITAAADYIKKNTQYRGLLLEGHCDWRGTSEYNLALGDRRAQAVKKFLESLGIPADKLQILSKGSLGATEKGTEEQMSKDRRVEFVVLKK